MLEKKVRAGQFVKDGDVLYTIADLSQVWLVVEVYESELAWVRIDQPVQITLESEPDRPATGRVGFIEPVLNDATRTVRVRVSLENPEGRFRPGMYASTLLRVPVPPDGSSAAAGSHDNAVLAVPAEAVLTTGRRQLAYREVEPGKYEVAELKLGPRVGDYYPVASGLKEGDRVVTRGGFLLDSQFQISGKTCLLYARSELAEKPAHACCQTAAAANGLTAKELANLEKLPEEDRARPLPRGFAPLPARISEAWGNLIDSKFRAARSSSAARGAKARCGRILTRHLPRSKPQTRNPRPRNLPACCGLEQSEGCCAGTSRGLLQDGGERTRSGACASVSTGPNNESRSRQHADKRRYPLVLEQQVSRPRRHGGGADRRVVCPEQHTRRRHPGRGRETGDRAGGMAGRSPQDVDDQVTYPLTVALEGTPEVKAIRSMSGFGVGMVFVILNDDVDYYWARSRVLERMNVAKRQLPAGDALVGYIIIGDAGCRVQMPSH